MIGREFSWRLLEAVSPITGPALQDALSQLIEAQLIHVRGVPPEAIYVFKHALVQNTAYASLLRRRRQCIHADIARALMERFADESASAAAVVARHFTEAGLFEPAGRYWLMAAELSLSGSAHAEAVRYADAGLASAARLEDTQKRQSLELALYVARAKSLLPLKGYSAPDTVAALTAAKRILDAGTGSDLQRFSVLDGLCSADMVASRMEPALVLARQMTQAADRQDDPTYRLIAHRQLAAVQVFMGDHREALASLQLAEQYRDPAREKPLSHRFGVDPGLDLVSWKIVAMSHLGLLNQAALDREQLQIDLLRHGHPQTVAACTVHSVVWPALLLGDFEGCERRSAELLSYCTEKSIEPYRIFTAIFHACAQAVRNPTGENIAAIRAALDANHRSGGSAHEALFLAHLAEALLSDGDMAGAEAAVQDGFSYVERSQARHWLAELHRLEGVIALMRLEPGEERASLCFLKSMEIAGNQGARILELRAAIDLARLWRKSGSIADPHALLKPILADIQGGQETRDVRNARVLLASWPVSSASVR